MFNNTGNYHFKAQAEAVVKDQYGNALFNASSPMSSSSIIPTYSWLFKLPLDGESGSGTYKVEANVIKADGTFLDSEEATIEL